MDDKTRFKTITVISVFLIIGVLALLVLLYLSDPEFEEFPLVVLVIAAVVILLPILMMLKVRKDLKQGFPLVDERGRAVKLKAGYYAFMATIYIVLGFMYYDFIIVKIIEAPSPSPTEYFLILDFVIIGVYFAFWWWFSRKGESTDSG